MPKELPNIDLTEQQEQFCQEYVLNGGNAGKAVIKAGYKVTTQNSTWSLGSQILSSIKVTARIEQLRKEAGLTFISKEYIVNGFKEIAERCMSEREVLDPETGESTGVFKFDPLNAKGAFKELALMAGHYDGDKSKDEEQAKQLANAIRAGMLLAKESVNDPTLDTDS